MMAFFLNAYAYLGTHTHAREGEAAHAGLEPSITVGRGQRIIVPL